jgi:hypothetical protein
MDKVLLNRFGPYFMHPDPDPDHDVLDVGDRAIACKKREAGFDVDWRGTTFRN